MPDPRHPRADAEVRLGPGHTARVLEPSPPANTDPDWWADDPTDPGDTSDTVVSPTSDGDRTWEDVVSRQADLADFARGHWLGPRRRLGELPDTFARTRDDLHHVAFFVVSPWRYRATGKLGLRWTRGGFGTPFQPGDTGDEQLRVEGGQLVHQQGTTVRTHDIDTVSAATRFLGMDYREQWFDDFHDPLAPQDPDQSLAIDPVAVAALGDWFGFATAVLEELRRLPGADDVSRVQLWPEHLDPAVELGNAEAGQRASYGASPGDGGHPTPYLYITPWGEADLADPFWNAPGFTGAVLSLNDLLDADDQYQTALDFLIAGHHRLAN